MNKRIKKKKYKKYLKNANKSSLRRMCRILFIDDKKEIHRLEKVIDKMNIEVLKYFYHKYIYLYNGSKTLLNSTYGVTSEYINSKSNDIKSIEKEDGRFNTTLNIYFRSILFENHDKYTVYIIKCFLKHFKSAEYYKKKLHYLVSFLSNMYPSPWSNLDVLIKDQNIQSYYPNLFYVNKMNSIIEYYNKKIKELEENDEE